MSHIASGIRWRVAAALLVSLLPAGCSSGGHVTPLGRVPHDVEVVFQEDEYPVSGRTEAEIGRSIGARGLTTASGRPAATSFHWTMESDFTYRPAREGEGCVMDAVRIRVRVSLTTPRWDPPGDAPPELVAAWERYMTAVHVHEEGHRDHVLSAARELRRELRRFETDNCSFMQGDAEALHDRILERWRRTDLEYEVETEQGRTQGAVWPPGR